MHAPSSPNSPALKSFFDFPRLPVEIRCQIWSFAAPRRPRILQVFYAPEQKVWQACKDGCGGLPSIVHVSREARAEALKGYTKTLDAYIHLEEDTIFISDPVFKIREPRATFMGLEYVNKFERIALSSDVYQRLESTFYQYPKLSESPARILRKFEGLKHFTLAVSDDGEAFRDGPLVDGHQFMPRHGVLGGIEAVQVAARRQDLGRAQQIAAGRRSNEPAVERPKDAGDLGIP